MRVKKLLRVHISTLCTSTFILSACQQTVIQVTYDMRFFCMTKMAVHSKYFFAFKHMQMISCSLYCFLHSLHQKLQFTSVTETMQSIHITLFFLHVLYLGTEGSTCYVVFTWAQRALLTMLYLPGHRGQHLLLCIYLGTEGSTYNVVVQVI